MSYSADTLQSDPGMIKQIMEAVSIPVMAKVRIGHTVEAQILQSIGVDYIDVRSSSLVLFGTSLGPSSLWGNPVDGFGLAI